MNPYQQFLRLIRNLNLEAQRDTDFLFRTLRGSELADALADLVQTYGSAAAAVSADWYDELRADTGVRPGFSAVIPEPKEPGTGILVDWALNAANTDESFHSLVKGGIERRITNYSRNTVTTSAVRDPRSRGWMRVGNPECGFCAMLISRGAVYTKESIQFRTHDWCNCGAAPAWSPDQVNEIRREFVPSARRRSEETKAEDVARAKEWIAENL